MKRNLVCIIVVTIILTGCMNKPNGENSSLNTVDNEKGGSKVVENELSADLEKENDVIIKSEEGLKYNNQVFELIYELPNSTNIYYSDSKAILLEKAGERKVVIDENLSNKFSSAPQLSPDGKNLVYIAPFEFELNGNVYIYNLEKDTNDKVIPMSLKTDETAKVVKWVNDDKLLVIIGCAVGTVSKGGKLYEYNRSTKAFSLLMDPGNDEEIIDFEVIEEHIKLEMITWNDDATSYTTQSKNINFAGREIM